MVNHIPPIRHGSCRRGQCRQGMASVMVVSLILLTLVALAVAIDLGRIVSARSKLQATADAAAEAAVASMNKPRDEMARDAVESSTKRGTSDTRGELQSGDVRYGVWDPRLRQFQATRSPGNAVRVTARATHPIAGPRLFLGGLFRQFTFPTQASAVAFARPREIVFVVDLSGSMNDDFGPINHTAGQDLYDDLGYGEFPGELEYIGAPWNIPSNEHAYENLTAVDGSDGPLAADDLPAAHRILSSDDERARKRKAYSAIIDRQIARLMPGVIPPADSSLHYDYWAKYLDYLIAPAQSPSRGSLPPKQGFDRIDRFGRVAGDHDSVADRLRRTDRRNQTGYLTYVQFLLDHGRSGKPDGIHFVPLSRYSADCPWHSEDILGETFDFPPRTQPMHSVRRAMIRALQGIKQHNLAIADPGLRDRVALITFDRVYGGGPIVQHPLSADYDAVMRVCTALQASSDKGPSTAMDSALAAGRELLSTGNSAAAGREEAERIVILLSDGLPNIYVSDPAEIERRSADGGSSSDDTNPARAAQMLVSQMADDDWKIFAMATGRSADRDFMQRLAELGATAAWNESNGPAGNVSTNCEQTLQDLIEHLLANPSVQVVQ